MPFLQLRQDEHGGEPYPRAPTRGPTPLRSAPAPTRCPFRFHVLSSIVRYLAVELGQRLRNITAVVVVAHGPGLCGTRYPRNPSKVIGSQSGAWAAPDLPLCAVPVLNECLAAVAAADEGL